MHATHSYWLTGMHTLTHTWMHARLAHTATGRQRCMHSNTCTHTQAVDALVEWGFFDLGVPHVNETEQVRFSFGDPSRACFHDGSKGHGRKWLELCCGASAKALLAPLVA